ncbi:MAG: hypothetical protein ACRDPR_14445 [Nocardioidaceae bacterium]
MTQDRLLRTGAGISLVLSPILALVAWFIRPGLDSDEQAQLGTFADSAAAVDWAIVLNMLSVILAVFAVLGVLHLLREKDAVLGYVGGATAIAGMVLIAVSGGVEGAANALARSGVTSDTVAVYEDIVTGPVGWMLIIGGVLMGVGLLMLAVNLYQTRVVPEPSAALIGLFAVGQFIGFAIFSTPVVLASFAVLAVATIPVGYMLLTETDEQWKHAPRFHWYRPVGI